MTFFILYLFGCNILGRFIVSIGILLNFLILTIYGFFIILYCFVISVLNLYYLDFCELLFIDTFNVILAFHCDALYLLILLCINVTYCFVIFYALYYLFFDINIIRFISILSMFVLWMNCFLLSFDFITAYINWEFIGLFSFFLISYFWFRHFALKCGFKAFFIGKLGDLSLFLAFIYIFKHMPFLFLSFNYINALYDYYYISLVILMITLCAFTKSTQFGLHIWLPDAMEGPIPVSALIHAATLVVCGILLVSFHIGCFNFWLSTLYFIYFWSAGLLVLLAVVTLSNFDVKRGPRPNCFILFLF